MNTEVAARWLNALEYGNLRWRLQGRDLEIGIWLTELTISLLKFGRSAEVQRAEYFFLRYVEHSSVKQTGGLAASLKIGRSP